MDNLSDPNQLPEYGENYPFAWNVGESWDDGMDDLLDYQDNSRNLPIRLDIWPKLLFSATILGCAVVGMFLFYLTAEGNFSEVGTRSKAASEGLNSPEVQMLATKQESSAAFDEKTNCLVSEGYPGKVRRWCDFNQQALGSPGLATGSCCSGDFAGKRRKSRCIFAKRRSRINAGDAAGRIGSCICLCKWSLLLRSAEQHGVTGPRLQCVLWD